MSTGDEEGEEGVLRVVRGVRRCGEKGGQRMSLLMKRGSRCGEVENERLTDHVVYPDERFA